MSFKKVSHQIPTDVERVHQNSELWSSSLQDVLMMMDVLWLEMKTTLIPQTEADADVQNDLMFSLLAVEA